jgi:predicted phosphodiesterase
VLQEIPNETTIVVGGDICAGGAHPSETLERLRALGERVLWLRGNADRELTPGEEGLAPVEVIEETRAALTAEQIAFLYRLPPTVQINDMLFCHATPRNDVDIFTERTPEEQIAHLFADVDADVVVCGHTHTQFERTIAGKRRDQLGQRRYALRGRARRLLDARPRASPHRVQRRGAAEGRTRAGDLALRQACRRRLNNGRRMTPSLHGRAQRATKLKRRLGRTSMLV